MYPSREPIKARDVSGILPGGFRRRGLMATKTLAILVLSMTAIVLLGTCWASRSFAQTTPVTITTSATQSGPTLDAPSHPAPAAFTADRFWSPPATHRFWDGDNDWLFAGVGASRTLDYFSTLNFRRRGRDEVFLTNDLVDNHAAFAAVEAGATGLSIGLSYVFHHYGHHKLERWTSIVHFSAATTGAVRNYCLKTAHSTAP
jgi:hypothetical protein